MFILYDAKLMILFYMTKYIMLLIVKMRYKISQKILQKILEIYFGFQPDFWFELLVISMRLTPVLKPCSEVMLQEWLSMDAGFNLIEINHAYQEAKRILFSLERIH